MDYIASWELVTLEARITQINKGTDVDRLSKAAQEIDRCDLTKAGRGLQKHGSRPDAVFYMQTMQKTNVCLCKHFFLSVLYK